MFASEESGQGMVEYALIIALIAVVLIGTLSALSTSIGDVFGDIKTELASAVAGGGAGGGGAGGGGAGGGGSCTHAGFTNAHKCGTCGVDLVTAHAYGDQKVSGTNNHKCSYDGCEVIMGCGVEKDADNPHKCKWCNDVTSHSDADGDSKCDAGCGYHQYKKQSLYSNKCNFCNSNSNHSDWRETTKNG